MLQIQRETVFCFQMSRPEKEFREMKEAVHRKHSSNDMEKGNRGELKYSFDLSLSRAPVLLPFVPPAVRENGVDIICTKRI